VLVEPKYVPARLEATGLVLDPSGELTVAAAGSAGTVGSRGFLLGFSADGGQSAGPTGLGVVVTRARGEILPAGPDRVVAWSESIQHSVLAVDSNGRAVRAYGSKGTGAAGFPRGFHPMAVEPAPGGGLAVVGAIGPRAMAVYRLGPSGRPIRSFGDGGLARVIFPRGFAIAFAGLVEPDGGIVLTGWVNNHVAAARLLPNGRLDPRFGKDGLVRGLLGDGAFGSLVAPWGGGVVIATIKKAVPRFASTGLIRLNRHGHLVRGFGQRGVVPPKAKNTPLALLTGGGRIVVVTNPRFERGKRRGVELRAYRADGSPDRGFGDRGLVRADAGKRHQFLPAAAVQQRDGKIVVAGSARYGEGTQVGLMRFR
jgi:uncharacterized delta-60 repeat protein